MKTRNLPVIGTVIGGLGVGASLMYVFDPLVGRRRRAVARDKVAKFAHKTVEGMETTSNDILHRARGIMAETKSWMFNENEVSDNVLAGRVRSQLGFLVSHPRSIEVGVEDGNVTLSGPILEGEIDRLLRRISAMRGVRKLENRLEAHANANSVPGLQGKPRQARGLRADIMQSSWSPATRFIVGSAAGASLFYGARRRDGLGTAAGVLGTGLLARALTNLEFRRLIGIGAGAHAIDVQKIINIAAPVEQVFSFWSNYQNFPTFMSNVREVTQIDEHRSHWITEGPAGASVEWDATITSFVPNQLLAWETAPESPIQHAGQVQFRPNADGSTRLDIRLSYNPIAGAVGHALATLFRADPKSQMDQDLMRMKTMIETGVQPHDAAGKAQEAASIH
jgi:uncharacterized membrane protein